MIPGGRPGRYSTALRTRPGRGTRTAIAGRGAPARRPTSTTTHRHSMTDSQTKAAARGWQRVRAPHRDAIIQWGLRVLPRFDRLLMRFAATPDHAVFPNALFPWGRDLEACWEAIRDEAQEVLRDPRAVPAIREVSPDHDKIALDDRWRSFFLWGYGVRVANNCARCPQTAALLERIPDLLTAFFSIMLPGAHVPRHTGPTKAIVTGHLGLSIPRERARCHMQVADHDVQWEPGRLVLFDDMYPHEVWNDTAEPRVILLLHLKRPLHWPGTWLRDLFFAALRASPFVRDGVRNLERWEQVRVDSGG